MKKQSSSVLKSCIILIILIYGIYDLSLEAFYSFLPVGIALSLVLYIGVSTVRIAPPSKADVEDIIGDDLWLENETNSADLKLLKVIAHRGAGLDAPENTMTAFKMCAEKGCKAIEFDVNLTKDDVPVVFHDSTLERIADTDMRISKHYFHDLSNYDISAKHPLRERFQRTSIPMLYETVEQILGANQKMFIDLKRYDTKMMTIILDLYRRYPALYKNAVVSSFFPNLIYMIRKRDPKIVCSLAWRPHIFAYQSYSGASGKGPKREEGTFRHLFLRALDVFHEWFLMRITYYILGIPVILLHKDIISLKTVSDWKSKGVRVMAWTVNTPTDKMYMSKTLRISYFTDTLVGENSIHGRQSS